MSVSLGSGVTKRCNDMFYRPDPLVIEAAVRWTCSSVVERSLHASRTAHICSGGPAARVKSCSTFSHTEKHIERGRLFESDQVYRFDFLSIWLKERSLWP